MTNNRSGIYSITNTLNGHMYIGSAVNISRRWSDHTRHLNKNEHHSIHLQNAWNKYGEDAFEFTVLEYCEKEQLIEREQFYIDEIKPIYNTCPIAGSVLGAKRSAETRAKMSTAKSGERHPNFGKHISEEQKLKLSAAMKGNTNSLGYKQTEEHKRKVSAAQTGENNSNFGKHPSEETRLKLRESHKGKVHSEETRAKISAARQNISDETRRKISEASKHRWEKRRAAMAVGLNKTQAL